MKNNRNLRAFSLIEISIVLLIIGILIAGVTQSSRMIYQARLNTAKSLTQSSPAASVKNMVLWIESTSDESFTSTEADNGLTISNWYDINPQSSTQADFSQATAANKPTYTLDVLNGLPAIRFDGTNDVMTATTSSFSNITTGQVTVFAVVKLPTTLAAQTIISKRTGGGGAANLQLNTTAATATGWQFCDSISIGTGQTCTNGYTNGSGASVVAGNSYILSVIYTGNSASSTTSTLSGGISFFQNGSLLTQATTTGTTSQSATDSLSIGASSGTAAGFFGGYIAEIIVYDRSIKKEERQAVEQYLGKKWKISTTTASI